MWLLKKILKFDAAHHLCNYDGQCANVHGHSWKVEVDFEIEKLDDRGIGIDFKVIKKIVEGYLPDHQNLNDVYKFNPTAENIAKHLYDSIHRIEPTLMSVTVWESDTASATYVQD